MTIAAHAVSDAAPQEQEVQAQREREEEVQDPTRRPSSRTATPMLHASSTTGKPAPPDVKPQEVVHPDVFAKVVEDHGCIARSRVHEGARETGIL